jgi:hypothetical protein
VTVSRRSAETLLVCVVSHIAAASIGIRATRSQPTMHTRIGRQYGAAPTTQQQHEIMGEVLEQ